jgi:hypothetical protein
LDQCFGKRQLDFLRLYITANPEAVVITVDGNDIIGCHTNFRDQLSRVDLHFFREADPNPAEVDVPEEWGFSIASFSEKVKSIQAPVCF